MTVMISKISRLDFHSGAKLLLDIAVFKACWIRRLLRRFRALTRRPTTSASSDVASESVSSAGCSSRDMVGSSNDRSSASFG